jgi:hypothetical protein
MLTGQIQEGHNSESACRDIRPTYGEQGEHRGDADFVHDEPGYRGYVSPSRRLYVDAKHSEQQEACEKETKKQCQAKAIILHTSQL